MTQSLVAIYQTFGRGPAVLGAGLCSSFSNFRFGVPETGSIGDGDWFATRVSAVEHNMTPKCGVSEGSLGPLSQEPDVLLLLGP